MQQTLSNLSLKIEEKSAKEKLGYFHPNRVVKIVNEKGEQVGILAQVHQRICDRFGIQKRVAVVELSLH
jgi:phenylalanyl-tRNA synthetase beta subunit